MLVEDGHLVREGDSWRPARDLAAIHVPPTIAALLAARLDGLPADERQVAERASVVGRVFERVAVAELSPPEEREQVPTRLRSLVRRELIRPDPSSIVPDDTFRFRHILIRDAAYEALSKRDRAELHARFADWLEQTMQGRLAEFEEILGYHLDQAVRYREELGVLDATTSALRTRAADHLAAAGMRAGERSDSEPAIRLLSRAVALRQAGNDLRLDELFALAIAFSDETRDAEALPVVELARDRASQLGDGAGVLRADVHRASMRAITDPSFTGAELRAVAADAIERLDPERDVRALADAYAALGEGHLMQSRWRDAEAAFERARTNAQASGATGWVERSTNWIANTLVWGPTPVDAALERLDGLRPSARNRRAQIGLDIATAVLLGYRGSTDEAFELVATARRGLADIGLLGRVWVSNLWVAEIAFAAERWDRAVDEMTRASEALMRIGETGTRSTVEAFLALALARSGRDAEAVEHSGLAEELSAADDTVSQAGWRTARAVAFAHQGRHDEARSLAAEAVELHSTTDQLVAKATALEVEGDVLSMGGDAAAARQRWAAASEAYREKGHRLRGGAAQRAPRPLIASLPGGHPAAWRSVRAVRAAVVATRRPTSASRPAGGKRYDGPCTWSAATTSPDPSATPAATDEMPSANSSWTQA